MKRELGYPLPLGISEKNGNVNFSIVVEEGKMCTLCLYKKGADSPAFEIELLEKDAIGEVRFVAFPGAKIKGMEYDYKIDGELVLDPYVKMISANGKGKIMSYDYDWEDDKPLRIPEEEVIAYSMHVRGFTKHDSSHVEKNGTFSGVVEKIPYLKELGINQIQCMPVYAFEEGKDYKNYWGYGDAFCFVIKREYASQDNPEVELKDMESLSQRGNRSCIKFTFY